MAERSTRRGGPVDQIVNTRNGGEQGWDSGKADDPGTPAADVDYYGGIKKFSGHTEFSGGEPNRDKGSDWKPGKK